MTKLATFLVLVLVLPAAVAAAGEPREEEFRPLFNGRDLAGWVNVNCAPETFTVKEGMIVCTGVPTGVLRTDRQYENFVLELEWKHLHPKGNAGLFVWSDPLTATGVPFTRSIEVQILDGINTENYTSHGDVFAIHGSTMKPDRPHPAGWMRSLPSERRSKPAGEWNHCRVECDNGTLKLAVNGKVVSGASECNFRKGYICLESEGSEVHFRNIRIRELPSTDAQDSETAKIADSFRTLYTGLNLSGWKQEPELKEHWQPKNWTLNYDGNAGAAGKPLWTEKEYGDFALIFDWRLTGKPRKVKLPAILPDGDDAPADGKPELVEVDDAGESGVILRGFPKCTVQLWCSPAGSGGINGYRTDTSQPSSVRAGATPSMKADHPPGQWNRSTIMVRGDRLWVTVNGRLVIDNATLPGLPERGAIGLVSGDVPVQFANLFIRDLDEERAAAKRALENLEKLGAAVVRREDAEGSPTDDWSVSLVLLGSEWKGGDDGLKFIREHGGIGTLYYLDGVVSHEAIQALKEALPDLKVQRRSRAYLGLSAFPHPQGCQIAIVKEGSAADKAGLKQGDVIASFDGKPVKDFDTLIDLLADKKPGDEVKIEIHRFREKLTLTVTLGAWK